MQLDERFQLADQLRVATERELGLDPLLDRSEMELFEPSDLALRKRLVGELGERRAAPQSQRLPQKLEALQVKLSSTDAHQIATATGDHDAVRAVYTVSLKRPAQPRHVHLQA